MIESVASSVAIWQVIRPKNALNPYRIRMEAEVGIEPTNDGFANRYDLCIYWIFLPTYC